MPKLTEEVQELHYYSTCSRCMHIVLHASTCGNVGSFAARNLSNDWRSIRCQRQEAGLRHLQLRTTQVCRDVRGHRLRLTCPY